MKVIKRDNFEGVISIETHLPMNESGETKQELFLKSINLFYSILEKLKIKIDGLYKLAFTPLKKCKKICDRPSCNL